MRRQIIFSPLFSCFVVATITTILSIIHAFTSPSSSPSFIYRRQQQQPSSMHDRIAQQQQQQQQHQQDVLMLYGVIRGDDFDLNIDIGQGGVRLAAESAIKITGDVKHKPGSAEPKIQELLRYTKYHEITKNDIDANSNMAQIVGTGQGKELYKDPGDTTRKEVILAPLDAVRDAIMNDAGSTQDADRIVINFLGGDDLQLFEVLTAVEQLVLDSDVKTNTKISFNSLCHTSFPLEKASLTVVAILSTEDKEVLRGQERSIAEGEIYFQDDKYYTVIKDDITDAVA